MYSSIPENIVPVQLTLGPVTTNNGLTTDYISLKNAHRVCVVMSFKQAVGHATGIDPVQAQAVAGTNVKAITSPVVIWSNEDCSASSALTRQTDAITYDLAADVKYKMVVFDIDPAGFDIANGFDCLAFTIDNSAQATNFVNAVAYIVPRYPGVNFIVD